MKELIGTAVNEYYTKGDDGEFTPSWEVVLMLSESEYQVTEDARVSRYRNVTTVRFCVNKAGMGLLMKTLIDTDADAGSVSDGCGIEEGDC